MMSMTSVNPVSQPVQEGVTTSPDGDGDGGGIAFSQILQASQAARPQRQPAAAETAEGQLQDAAGVQARKGHDGDTASRLGPWQQPARTPDRAGSPALERVNGQADVKRTPDDAAADDAARDSLAVLMQVLPAATAVQAQPLPLPLPLPQQMQARAGTRLPDARVAVPLTADGGDGPRTDAGRTHGLAKRPGIAAQVPGLAAIAPAADLPLTRLGDAALLLGEGAAGAVRADDDARSMLAAAARAPSPLTGTGARLRAPVDGAVATYHNPAAPGSAEWNLRLGQDLLRMTRLGQHQAQIMLHPRELGPIHIALSINDGNQVQIHIAAAHAHARDAAEAALPQLRQAFADGGLSLGQASVGDQSSHAAFASGGDGSPGQRQHAHTAGDEAARVEHQAAGVNATDWIVERTRQATARGRIDLVV